MVPNFTRIIALLDVKKYHMIMEINDELLRRKDLTPLEKLYVCVRNACPWLKTSQIADVIGVPVQTLYNNKVTRLNKINLPNR